MYETPELSNDEWSSVGFLNLPKDLSILNRRGYASTTRKGVPLVYRVAITMSQHNLAGKASARDDSDGTGQSTDTDVETAVGGDNSTLMKVSGAQNNWVTKNAAVKLHAAREKWLRKTGVPKRLRGAYSHEIRYAYDNASTSWLATYDGEGASFVGGTWDLTEFADDQDNSYQVRVVGAAVDETAATTGTVFSLNGMYLNSRANQLADTNPETDDTPAKYSHINFMLGDLSIDEQHDVAIGNIQDEQDNPPYDVWAVDDLNNDITEPVELGRCIAGPGSGVGTIIADVPFGLAEIHARHAGALDQTIVDPVAFSVEVLDIFEMQG